MDELAIIDKIFRPLAAPDAPAFGLKNDTAIYTPPENHDLVITTDVMIEGVHFLKTEEPGVIARRLLRSNLSDLAASAATPVGYLLGLMGTAKIKTTWWQAFGASLAFEQKEFGIALFGGDTTSGSKSLCLSITALGIVQRGGALTRLGASPGDLVCVSGTIGDAALGLLSLKGDMPHDDFLIARFQNPLPRLEVGRALLGLASATIDISDGLVMDLESLCAASKVGATLDLGAVPLSPPAQDYADAEPGNLIHLVTGGDDFELLFTVPPQRRADLPALAKKTGLPITVIGEINDTRRVDVRGKDGRPVAIKTKGYRHFKE